MFKIDGKVALVTGGISGIGLHCAQELLKNGIKGITLVDVNYTVAQDALENIEKVFGVNKAIFFKADVTKSDEIEAAFEKTVEKFGNIDIVINSAGLLDDAHWEKEGAVNVNGVINTMILGINKYLSNHQQGSEAVILNVSSRGGIRPAYFYPIYSGTKCAVIGFTRAWGQDQIFQKTKVRVIAVCPGGTDTPMMANVREKLCLDLYIN